MERKERVISKHQTINTGIGLVNIEEMQVHCPKCQQYLAPSLFYKNTKSKTGLSVYCKTCQSSYAKTPEWSAWRKQRYYADPAKTMWVEARNRAKKAKLPFDIEIEDCLIPEKCPVLGIQLSKKGDGTRCKSTPTLDRIIGSLSYVKGNVKVISWLANRIKSDCDDPEVFEAIAKYLRSAKHGT